jgi:hypothetical protein
MHCIYTAFDWLKFDGSDLWLADFWPQPATPIYFILPTATNAKEPSSSTSSHAFLSVLR